MACVVLVKYLRWSKDPAGDPVYKTAKFRMEADDPMKPAFARELYGHLNMSNMRMKKRELTGGWTEIKPSTSSTVYWQYKIADMDEAIMWDFDLTKVASSAS